MTKQIYLDHHAHTPLDPRVAAFLSDAFLSLDANPHSVHGAGENAHRAVESARAHVAALIEASPAEIIFTSGATEANNLALLGFMARLSKLGRRRLLVGAGEHPSILAAADAAVGGMAERIPLLATGALDLDALDAMLGNDVGLVSIAAANHEIGTVQPLEEIARRVRAAGALLHSDLAQASAWMPITADLLDLASISSHKMAGPVGIGALFVRRSHRRHLRPITFGGGQEHGARSGSVPAPLCAAFGEACRLARQERAADAKRVAGLRDEFWTKLAAVGGLLVNGGGARLPGNLNASFDGVDGEALVLRLRDQVAISTGSACTATKLEPSHVLQAIGLSERRIESAIRFGLGRGTTSADVVAAADAITAAVAGLRALSRRAA